MTFITSLLLLKMALALVTIAAPVLAMAVAYFDNKAKKEANARYKAMMAPGGVLSYK